MEIVSFANVESSARNDVTLLFLGSWGFSLMKIVSVLCTNMVSVTNTTLSTTLIFVWNTVS